MGIPRLRYQGEQNSVEIQDSHYATLTLDVARSTNLPPQLTTFLFYPLSPYLLLSIPESFQ